ncbi:hypothetical protein Poly30_50060 [Planctomycetes bacterium Poly30]|uniref:Glycosyltransferase RgtA/B/C/D-like domain-containing protein n=2 Tax=Saltatorellus ferox TaxID=2528018 RepID=A0A518EZF1_9BACT|nr:hypothetical protein Poly30_50060 [Planctomycetes bacterium Poly30]
MLVLVALAGAIISYFTFADFLFEDSYITLRYATNLASGQGLVFQSGEAVLGTSAPFWAMFLALPLSLGAQPEVVLDVAFCFSLAALGYAGGRLLQRLGSPGAGVAFALAVALGVGRLHAYWGMETPLFTALLLGAWCWALDRRYVLSGLCLGLACLTRYEGYAFGAAMAIVLASRGSWSAIRSGGLALAGVTLPWLGVAWHYYGNPIPLPAGAKAGHVSPLRYFERSYLDLPHDLFWPLTGPLADPTGGAGYAYPVGLALSVVLGILGLLGVIYLIKSRQFLAAALPLGGLFVFAVLIAFAPGPLCTWHRAPLHMIGLLCALYGLARLTRGKCAGPRWRSAGYAAAVLGVLAAIPIHRAASFQLRNTFQYVGREIAYPEIADFLRQTRLNETTVLTWEPGYLAFMSDARVIDVAGLVTPAPTFTAASTSRWDVGFPNEADLVLLRAPFRPEGFQLIFEGSMGSWLFARPRIVERYADAIEAYRSSNAEGAEVQPVTGGPVALTPSYSGPPFVIGPPGTLTRISPKQDMLALTAETPILGLDTPTLEIEFQTKTPNYVQLQLVVRGEVVLATKPGAEGEDPLLTWDVSPWRNRTAKVRVLAVAGSGADASFGVVRAAD